MSWTAARPEISALAQVFSSACSLAMLARLVSDLGRAAGSKLQTEQAQSNPYRFLRIALLRNQRVFSGLDTTRCLSTLGILVSKYEMRISSPVLVQMHLFVANGIAPFLIRRKA
jgi:hypothetical protein